MLLHSCCAPCSTSVIERLFPYYDITVFYYNPNIYPFEEYTRRRDTQILFLKEAYSMNIGFIEGEYNHNVYNTATDGYEHTPEGGARCEKCFCLRLFKTAETAAKRGFDIFGTTLSVSPHKNVKVINSVLKEASELHNVRALYEDFKKKDGFKRSIDISKEYGLYRQNYCGCGL